MTRPQALVGAVLAGRIVRLSDGETPSAIAKHPLDGPVLVGPEGIELDQQADRSVHGGPEKAILHYAFDHYAAWRAELAGDVPAPLAGPGAFGENISSTGLTEADVHIGDRIRIGEALFEVTQARQPCFKLNLRHGRPDMAYRVQKTGRTGWYYRVLEPGRIAAGDAVVIVERSHDDWPLPRAQALLNGPAVDRDGLSALARLPELSEAWRRQAAKKLAG